MKRLRYFLIVPLLVLFSLAAGTQQAANGVLVISVTNLPANITVDRTCYYVLLRENSASPTAIFSITLAGTIVAQNYPAGANFLFVAPTGSPFTPGTTLGTVAATTSGPFSFTATESTSMPSGQARNGSGASGTSVVTVSGTAHQIDSSGGTTPVLSLDAAIVLPGSLTVPTGSSITFSGSGIVNANELNGTALSGLATGLLKNTTTTGVPSIAVAADVYGLWSGTCNSGTYLNGAGACSAPAGGVSSVSGDGTVITNSTSTGAVTLTIAGTSGGIPYFSSSSAWASSGALTAHAIVLGGGAASSPTVLGSLGTTTTLLHGNASGTPTFAAVDLATDVADQLPISAVGSAGLSGSAPVSIAATGVISCSTCVTGSGTASTPTEWASSSAVENGVLADFVTFGLAPLASPALSGVPTAPTPATSDNSTTLATTAYVQGQGYLTSAGATPGLVPNQVLTGGGVEWTGLLDFTVGATTYSLNGVTYSSALTNLTLSPADATNPRIDDIIVDNTGTASVVTGTPAASPLAPTTDASTQLILTFVYIAANATVPTGVSAGAIYQNGAVWTTTTSGSGWNTSSTTDLYDGYSNNISATAVARTAYVQFVVPSSGTVTLGTYNSLVFYIRSMATWNTARSLTLQWYSGTTALGTAVLIRGTGTFGFSSATTTAYQQITIPTTSFGIATTAVNTLRITVSGTTGASTIGFYLADMTLQGGAAAPPVSSTTMLFLGAYSSTTAYTPNQVVTYLGGSYISLVGSTASTPTLSNGNWASLGGNVSGPSSSTSGHVASFNGTSGILLQDSGVVSANLVVASSPGAGVAHFAGSTQTVTSSTIATADIANNAVTSAKEAVVNTRRVCDIAVGDESSTAIANGQLGPQVRVCYIPAAATVVEMDVAADGGTPNVIVAVNHAGSDSNIVSAALATAANGGIACSNTTGTTGINGATTCSSTLENTSMAAGDFLELVSGTAGGTAKLMTIHIVYTVN